MAENQTLDMAFKQIAQLRQALDEANRTIRSMQRVGGFADSKAISMRATRNEERLERLEADSAMFKDMAGMSTDWFARHLLERHQVAEQDNASDSIIFRKMRRRLAEWAEKAGLMNKRRDLNGARQDENRLRPAVSQI